MAKTYYFWAIFVLMTGTLINEGPLYKYMGFVFGLKAQFKFVCCDWISYLQFSNY